MPPKPANRANQIDLLIVLADLHCGSTVAVCPPDVQITDGGYYKLNPVQEWLWEQWNECTAWAKQLARGRKFGVVINGDAIEGDHHRSHQIVTPDLDKQLEIAIETVAMVSTGSERTWVVHGTDTHVGHAKESELGFHLGAERDDVTGYFFHHHLQIEVCGTRCSFQHHISTTKRKYLEGSALSIEAGNEQLAAARHGQPVPKVMGRAHRHLFGQYTDGDVTMIVSPPWKLLDNHTRKVAPGSVPVVGAYALDWRGKPDGSLPDVRQFLRAFPSPKPRRV